MGNRVYLGDIMIADMSKVNSDIENISSEVTQIEGDVNITKEKIDNNTKGLSPMTNAHISKTNKWESALIEGDDLQWVETHNIQPISENMPMMGDMLWNEDFKWA